ncbi:MAG: AAA family ATPase, partial [Thermomicrobiales bacterium]
GLSVYNPRDQDFQFRPGPVFTQVLLADEINRATPRTQSALLEAMEERTVTVDGQTMPLPRPFLVLATQNPIELEGTFPLPEAQLDSFFLRTAFVYPALDDERAMLRRFQTAAPLETVERVTTPKELLDLIAATRRVLLGEAVEDYLLAIVRGTREDARIELGASPRAALALARAVRALAALAGRAFVIPDDVQALAVPVLAHRIIPAAQVSLRGTPKEDLIAAVVASVPAPVETLPAGAEAGR